jgi:hypothetical protein
MHFIKKKFFYTNNYNNAVFLSIKIKLIFFNIIYYEYDKKKYYANNYLKKNYILFLLT